MESPEQEIRFAILSHSSNASATGHAPLESNFNLETAVSGHGRPAASIDILNKCQEEHKQVIQKHCEESGFIFYKTSDNYSFNIVLPQNALEKALEEAFKESIDLLKKMLSLKIYNIDKDEEEFIKHVEAHLKEEGERVKEFHMKLQTEFIDASKAQILNQVVESVKTEYYHLYVNKRNGESEQICFYDQTKMEIFVTDLLAKSKQNLAKKLAQLEGNHSFLNCLERTAAASSDPLIELIQKNLNDMLAKNKKHEDDCKNYIEDLMHTDYKKEGTRRLRQMVKNDPFSFPDRDHLVKGNEDLKNKYLEIINEFSEIACMERREVFRRLYIYELEFISNKIVNHNTDLMREENARLDEVYKETYVKVRECIQQSFNAKAFPECWKEKFEKGFMKYMMSEFKEDGTVLLDGIVLPDGIVLQDGTVLPYYGTSGSDVDDTSFSPPGVGLFQSMATPGTPTSSAIEEMDVVASQLGNRKTSGSTDSRDGQDTNAGTSAKRLKTVRFSSISDTISAPHIVNDNATHNNMSSGHAVQNENSRQSRRRSSRLRDPASLS